MPAKTRIDELAPLLAEPYRHLELAQVNDHAAYLVRFQGSFPSHRHTKDEMYLVLQGEIRLEFTNEPPLDLRQNESTVVRAYTTHSSSSEHGALVLMVKPKEMFAPAPDGEYRTEG